MSRYRFQLATRSDDAELREILADTPMPGRITVRYQREPSYFDGAVVYGSFHQVIIGRDDEEDQIVGFGSRSIRDCYVNGDAMPIGYLCNLRARQSYRGSGLLARGYAFLRKLHRDGKTSLYLTTIAEGNERAVSVLTSGRAGLPCYSFAGNYHAVLLSVPRRRRVTRSVPSDLEIRPAEEKDVQTVVEFCQRVGPQRQFFPKYGVEDFFNGHGTFKDLPPTDLMLAFRAGRLVGTLGGWDQHGFRQSIVESYPGYLRAVRPLYNWWAHRLDRTALPRPGTEVRYLTAALSLVENEDEGVFRSLLEHLLLRAADGPFSYVMLGMHEADPLLHCVPTATARRYTGGLYLVYWPEGEALRMELDKRPVYLEIGTM
jgi:hypothetical protein